MSVLPTAKADAAAASIEILSEVCSGNPFLDSISKPVASAVEEFLNVSRCYRVTSTFAGLRRLAHDRLRPNSNERTRKALEEAIGQMAAEDPLVITSSQAAALHV